MAIRLLRLGSRSNLGVATNFFFDLSSSRISKIHKNTVIYFYQSYAHLFNVDNCVHNKKYLKLLLNKSRRSLLGVYSNTTHMLNGTYFKISKPIKHVGSGYDPVYDAAKKKNSDTVTSDFVTGNYVLLIKVTLAVIGFLHHMTVFHKSTIASRPP